MKGRLISIVHLQGAAVSRAIRQAVAWALLAGVFASAGHAQPAQSAPDVGTPRSTSLSLEVYGLDEGLSQLAVTAMRNDDRGFLWVATQEGLNRFDGHRFRAYRSNPGNDGSGALVSSSIDSLAFDPRDSRLWLGSNDAGLEVLDLEDWTRWRIGPEQGLSHPRITRMLLDPDGGAWLGTEKGVDHVGAGLDKVNRIGSSAEIVDFGWSPVTGRPLALDERCQLWAIAGQVLQPLLQPQADTCVALQTGPEGLWLLAARGGLYHLDTAGRVLRHWDNEALLPDSTPSAMIRLKDGRLLLGFSGGEVLELAPGEHRPRRLRFDRALGSAITRFHQDSSGSWWIGTYTSGLARVRPLSSVILSDPLDIGTMQDWRSRSLRSIWRGDGVEMLGTDDGLMVRTQQAPGWREIAGLESLSIRAIRSAAGGGWWIGTMGGLFRLTTDLRALPVDGLPDPRIDDLLADGDGLLIATRSGVMRLREGVLQPEPRAAALDGRMIATLHRDRDGSIWIGSNDAGLWRIVGEQPAQQVQPAGDGMHKSVWAIHDDAQAIWVGTFSAGLYRIDRRTGRSRQITTRDGLSNDVIYRILDDGQHRLWLSTNNGISVYDPDGGIVQNLSRRDGLHNQEFNSGAAFDSHDGRIYVGGTLGLDVLVPRQLPRHSAPAQPVLTALRIFDDQRGDDPHPLADQDIVYASSITLPREDSVFSIDMTAIDFLAPAAAQLRYRVLGLQEAWIHPHQARMAFSLNHLPAGDYTLEVQAAGRDGRFGPSRRLDISVPPPPWRQPAAYALYALLALLLGWLAVRRLQTAVRREREQVELLNRTVAERTAQLSEANAQLLRSNAQLDEANRTDPLTLVSNRRELHRWLDEECPRLLAGVENGQHEQLFFFLCDIDHFKQVNDSYGHQTGDDVLVAFAHRLRSLCRSRDLLVRWGGEEFVLVAHLEAYEAARLAERIRSAVADTPVALPSGTSLPLTCSIGFAAWPLSTRWPALGDWEQSVALADRCLYAAKASGRNAWVGVAVTSSEPDRQALQAVLGGADPLGVGDGVRCLHSTPQPPTFAT